MGRVLKSLETDARVTHMMLCFQRFINQMPKWFFRSTEKKIKEQYNNSCGIYLPYSEDINGFIHFLNILVVIHSYILEK